MKKVKSTAKSNLQGPYMPESEACVVLNTIVPDSMDYETKQALKRVKDAVGNIDDFVRDRLKFKSTAELCNALAAEQVDAVALCIYNIEFRAQACIDGDQTGIGKGRVAAAMIRYACLQKITPIFITEKPNLFSDIYRDLKAIGSASLVPFIVNAVESKTDVKDEDGEVIYKAPNKVEQDNVFKSQKLPSKYNYIVSTYTQFNSVDKKPLKPKFLSAMAKNSIIILDESHNASGSSNTGEYLQNVVAASKGAVFLSATFAKRPDNMPIYASKTAISEAAMTKEELVEAITKGGTALQEILASQLVLEGQMIRRERSFEGIEVNYVILEELEQEHRAVSDNITSILRDIIGFQLEHVDTEIEARDEIVKEEGEEIKARGGTSEAGIKNSPAFSKVFQVVFQMLFSIKCEAIADQAIKRLKEGKKPVIAFTSTMGSFLDQMEDDDGMPVKVGDKVNADFTEVLMRGLKGVLRFTKKLGNGKKEFGYIELSELSVTAQANYFDIAEKIRSLSSGISISPIDIIVEKIERAGFTTSEVTGRVKKLKFSKDRSTAIIEDRKKVNTNDAFRMFNNNEVDCLLINQSGSTGASAHAIVTKKVSREQVKQRVMIVLQPELDINREVQKRGRVNRTGQIILPIYDYLNSAIPAEKRLMMMLQQKLKSLDANTSSNQKQSKKILDVEDFLNKYGDIVVVEWLKENPDINKTIGDPLKLNDKDAKDVAYEDAAHSVSGRVAVLETAIQDKFYKEISERYNDLIVYLKQTGEYDLEVENVNLEAKTITKEVVKVGQGGASVFGRDSVLETVEANVLKKPFSKKELDNILNESLAGSTADKKQADLLSEYSDFVEVRKADALKENLEKYKELTANISKEKGYKKADNKTEYIAERKAALVQVADAANKQTKASFDNRKANIQQTFQFFHIGRVVNYPVNGETNGISLTKAVFLGFVIDKNRANPYATSAMKLRFALTNSDKYIALPASNHSIIAQITASSYRISNYDQQKIVDTWTEFTKKSSGDRSIRYIITGNILQAFATYSGKLVSYTTADGGIKKGILLPESFEKKENGPVEVPISKAASVLKSLTVGQSVALSGEFGIIRNNEGYTLVVPASKVKGGHFYTNTDLMALTSTGRFDKVSDKMRASVDLKNTDKLIDLLHSKFKLSISLKPHQLAQLNLEMEEYDEEQKPEAPKDVNLTLRIRIAKAKAIALKLKYNYQQAA